MNLSAHQPSTLLKANFVDPLQNDMMMDQALCSCSVSDGYLGPKVNWSKIVTINNFPVISPYVEEVIFSQTNSTKSRQINEFLVKSDNTVLVDIRPSIFYFVVDYLQSSSFNISSNDVITGVYKVPQHKINIYASGFNPKEDIRITIEGSIYLDTTDILGNFNESIDSPEMMSGTSLITIEGLVSGKIAKVSYRTQPIVQRQYVISNQPTIINYNSYNNVDLTNVANIDNRTVKVFTGKDPIAQTFQLSEDRDITSVDFYFTQKPTSNVFAMITETSSGVPDTLKILDRCMVLPSNVKIDGNPTKFTFSKPLPLEAGKLYAVLLGCSDKNAKIKVAEIGKKSLETGNYITTNPYVDGDLLQVSQSNSWTSLQSEDIKMTIRAARYNSTSYSKNVGSINVSNISDIMIMPFEYTPANASVSIEAKLAEDDIKHILGVSSPITLQDYTGNIQFTYSLNSSSNKTSPIFYSCQVALGKMINPSVYISRTFSTGLGTKLFVYLTSLIPVGCSVDVFYMALDGSWVQVTTGDIRYPDVEMGNNWIERTYVEHSFPRIDSTKLKIELSSINLMYRPYCVDLRAVFI